MFIRLRNLREDHDFTQKDIANKLNMAQSQYQRYESGIVTPPIDVLIFLANLYDVSLDYIVDRTDTKNMFGKGYEDEPIDIKRCISYFRRLDRTNKDIIIGNMASLIKEQKQYSNRKKVAK